MTSSRGFAEQATPVVVDLARPRRPHRRDQAAGPVLRAATISVAQPRRHAAGSQDARRLAADRSASSARPATSRSPAPRNLDQLLMTLRRTGGFDAPDRLHLNASNSFNGFDQLGHFLLAQLQITNCVDYGDRHRRRRRRAARTEGEGSERRGPTIEALEASTGPSDRDARPPPGADETAAGSSAIRSGCARAPAAPRTSSTS